jgi:hypothetical protein
MYIQGKIYFSHIIIYLILYICSYAPLSIRIIQTAFRPGWRLKEDLMRLLPGPTIEETQELPEGVMERGINATRNHVTLVFFVGGVTFTELSALRWLSRQEGMYGDFIVATTKLINGNTFLTSLMENMSPPAPAVATANININAPSGKNQPRK